MLGAVLILVVMILAGPIAVMLAGAVWSALMGWLHAETADAAVAATGEEPLPA